jgi:uncharacterized membrane protein
MAQLSRAMRRIDAARLCALLLALPLALFVAAYGVAASSSQPNAESVITAATFVAVAGAGFLYAWRLGAGGLVD